MKYNICAILTLCLLVQAQAMDIGDDEPLSGKTATISMSQVVSDLRDLSLEGEPGSLFQPTFTVEGYQRKGPNFQRERLLQVGDYSDKGVDLSISHVLVSPIQEHLCFQSLVSCDGKPETWIYVSNVSYSYMMESSYYMNSESGITSFRHAAELYRKQVLEYEQTQQQPFTPLLNVEDGEVWINLWWSSPGEAIVVDAVKLKVNALFETREGLVIRSSVPGGIVRQVKILPVDQKEPLFLVLGEIDFSNKLSPFYSDSLVDGGFIASGATVEFELGDD